MATKRDTVAMNDEIVRMNDSLGDVGDIASEPGVADKKRNWCWSDNAQGANGCQEEGTIKYTWRSPAQVADNGIGASLRKALGLPVKEKTIPGILFTESVCPGHELRYKQWRQGFGYELVLVEVDGDSGEEVSNAQG